MNHLHCGGDPKPLRFGNAAEMLLIGAFLGAPAILEDAPPVATSVVRRHLPGRGAARH